MSALCWMLAAGCSAFSRLMISLFLTTLVLFLAWPSTLVSAYIVFGDTNTNVSVPTVDYFQQSVKHYDRYGPMILPSFDQNASCTFKSPAPNPLVANTLARSGFSTVLAVNWTDAANSGCNNYGQVINALESIENAMQQSGFPVPFIILLMVPVYFPGPFGGPLTDKYLSHSAHTGNEFPRTDVAIMNIKDYSNFINNKDNAASTQYVRIVQEQGVWNRVFLSNGYVGITWTLFAINTVIILYGLYTLVMTLATRTFAADIRNVVFLLGIFAVIANATSIPLKNASYMRVVFEQISSFLSSIAFYMLLYLWSSLLSQIKQDRSMYPLRCFLFFGASVATWTIAINLIWLNHWDTSSIDSLIDVNFYLIPITQLMVAVLFCIVGYRFRSRRNQCRMSSDTQRALTKLAWLSVTGFATFLLQAISNLVSSQTSYATNVSAVAVVYNFLTIACTIRIMAIILVLGVRVPKHLRNTGGTSGIVSSTGELPNTGSFIEAEQKRLGVETLEAKMFFIQTYSPTYSPNYYHHNEAQRFSIQLTPDPLDNTYRVT